VLFCTLATVILHNDVLLGIEATYGTFALLLLLSGLFSLVVLLISKMPIPERVNIKQILLVLFGGAISVLVYQVLPVFGLFLLAASLLGIGVVLMPRSWRVSAKMALRNLGRRRTRAMTTMLALFIGIFCIGLVVGLGQDLQTQIADSFTQKLPYNIVATTSGTDTSTLHAQVNTIPGLKKSRQDALVIVGPVAINGRPSAQSLPTGGDRQTALSLLSGVDGYNLSQNVPALTILRGRNLNASDASTNNVIISELLTSTGQLHMHLKPGDTVTLLSTDRKTTKTVTIVGIYASADSFGSVGSVIASTRLVSALSSARSGLVSVFYLKVDPAQVNHALDTLGQLVPDANVQNLADAGAAFAQQLNSLLEMLVAIASLSVIAAVIIIANAVALAMLERRRELGILKSVGYTSSSVLSEVIIENGIVGGAGAFMATLLAAAAIALFGSMLFAHAFTLDPLIVVSLVIGSAMLAMFTAALVSWRAVRVRPLEVLRYE
ncbi:MAG: FtsX-like permease family protein, partial [Ktedonobacteraceae bacterium]